MNGEYEWRLADSLRLRLTAKLVHAEADILHRRRVRAQYQDGFCQLGLARPVSPVGSDTVYLRYPVLVRNKARVLSEARKWKVELGDLFASPIHPLSRQQWNGVRYEKGCCPIAEDTSERIVTLPLHETVRQSDIDRTLEFLHHIQQRSLFLTKVAPLSSRHLLIQDGRPAATTTRLT